MLLKMRVVYEGEEVLFDMPVGHGHGNTIKWLGLAAAQRFSAIRKPDGCRRHRERPGPAKIISTSAKLLPSKVFTKECAFLHPDKPIMEELEDGEEVTVVLKNKMPVNHVGKSQRDRWMFIAFNVSDRDAKEREELVQDEYRLMREDRERQKREELQRAKDLAAQKGAKMRRVLASQLYSPGKVEAAFERDWANLCHPIRQPIDKITEDLEEQSLVRDTMLAHYITVVEIFKHYASVGSSVTTGELDLMEFSAFMHDLRGFNAGKSRDVVEKTFAEAVGTCTGDKVRALTGTMGMPELMFASMRLSCIRHHVSPPWFHGGGGGAAECVLGSSKNAAKSAHEAIAMFMEGVMAPLAHRKVIGLQIKTALDTDDILALFYDNDRRLRGIFEKYGKADDRTGDSAAQDVLLNIAEFGMVLREAGLMGGNKKEDDELTVKEARQAFAGAQNDLCGGNEGLEVGRAIEQMTYPEFLEGIARVAILKWEDASMTAFEKIQRTVEALMSLLDKPSVRVPAPRQRGSLANRNAQQHKRKSVVVQP